MDSGRVTAAIDRALEGLALLEHPFYRRWEAGELEPAELAAYAEQYRIVEASLPAVLGTISRGLGDGPATRLVTANLAEELGVPTPHTELFESFAEAVGAGSDAPATPATLSLVRERQDAAARDPLRALAMVAAYEVQAGPIARTKGDGLREHYGLDADGTRFWDVHAAMEASHAAWSLDALAGSATDASAVAMDARAGASDWWAFLDEREAAAHAA